MQEPTTHAPVPKVTLAALPTRVLTTQTPCCTINANDVCVVSITQNNPKRLD